MSAHHQLNRALLTIVCKNTETADIIASRLEELERENAALREALKRWLKVADDCHQEQQEVGHSEYNITVGLLCDTRALLDTARKEAQP